MNQLILDYLAQNWSDENTDKIILAPVPKGNNGDLALNVFQLTKILKKAPPQILEAIQKVLENCDLLVKTEIAGPYLNLFFKDEVFFTQVLKTPLKSKKLSNKNIVLEFSGPNTNKPLHLGHVRNHALGIAVANILETAGAAVHRVNIINDRGVHICKSMLAYQKFGNGQTPESVNKKSDHFVGDYYVKFDQEAKKEASLNTEVQKMLVDWEQNDPDIRALWEKMNKWTLDGHAETYKRQGIKFEKVYRESDYYLEGKNIAEEGLQKGIFQKREDGAIVINFEDKQLGEKVILRADGTSIYLTQDLAVAVARDKDFHHPDEMIYTVADEQNYHFKVLFACLDRLGTMDSDKCYHLSYGLVHLPDGRMKSREGNVVDADNLMDDLYALAQDKINQNAHQDFSAKTTHTIAEQVQNAAWKYYLLRTTPIKSITFDKEKSIDFQGATGPYLQYAGVRIKSILKKYKNSSSPGKGRPGGVEPDLSMAEKPLGIKILEWPNTLNRAALEKNPTYIATYLMELAQAWSSFYAENSVLNAQTESLKKARVMLAKKVLDILETGLTCLGIEIPEKM